MSLTESHYHEDWFRIGSRELIRAKNLFQIDDLEGAAFNLHQAVEKYLKGFLLSHGWYLRRIHDLEILLNDAIKYQPSFEKFRQLIQQMSDYYFIDRYPFTDASGLDKSIISAQLKSTEDVVIELKSNARRQHPGQA